MRPVFYSSLRILGTVGAVVGLAMASCNVHPVETGGEKPPPVSAIEPGEDAVFTSTGEILALKAGPDSSVWAATTGGVLYIDGQQSQKWTRREGLPSHEALAVGGRAGQPPKFWFPGATAMLTATGWSLAPKEPLPARFPSFIWRKMQVAGSLEGLSIQGKKVPLPAGSAGTHLTGLLPEKTSLLVAIYGDGLWDWDGARWKRAQRFGTLPPEAREITALARYDAAGPLWLGTRRSGVFRFRQGAWQACRQPDEPYNHNIQYLQSFNGALWASTLEDGLLLRQGKQWERATLPQLSTVAARQLAVFKNALWARHGDGYVDKWDGARWARNVFPQLPRGKALSMAADDTALYLGQWGGWSEWSGAQWTHHFDVPELKNIPIIGVYAGPKYLWLLTQSRGVVRWDRNAQKAAIFDERAGLPDDWITSLVEVGDEVYAGTFVGGLARLEGEKWTVYSELQGENVTSLEPDGQGGTWVATRHGVWRISGPNIQKLKLPWLDEEVQALKAAPGGLWVGTRTSLNWVRLSGKQADV